MINWIARDWAIWSSIKFFAIFRNFAGISAKSTPRSCYLLVDLWLMWTHRSSSALWVGWKGWDEIITACNPIHSFEIHQLSLIIVDIDSVNNAMLNSSWSLTELGGKRGSALWLEKLKETREDVHFLLMIGKIFRLVMRLSNEQPMIGIGCQDWEMLIVVIRASPSIHIEIFLCNFIFKEVGEGPCALITGRVQTLDERKDGSNNGLTSRFNDIVWWLLWWLHPWIHQINQWEGRWGDSPMIDWSFFHEHLSQQWEIHSIDITREAASINIRAVVGQVNQMLPTPSFDIQSKALKSSFEYWETESNIIIIIIIIIAITQSQLIHCWVGLHAVDVVVEWERNQRRGRGSKLPRVIAYFRSGQRVGWWCG